MDALYRPSTSPLPAHSEKDYTNYETYSLEPLPRGQGYRHSHLIPSRLYIKTGPITRNIVTEMTTTDPLLSLPNEHPITGNMDTPYFYSLSEIYLIGKLTVADSIWPITNRFRPYVMHSNRLMSE